MELREIKNCEGCPFCDVVYFHCDLYARSAILENESCFYPRQRDDLRKRVILQQVGGSD